ncbi:hypothetical protein C8R44DRAFT_783796 [Mycena epipterygia]|nr:hypothetical protein C8R44DRAFT_783796 [Mycena epipterygia]
MLALEDAVMERRARVGRKASSLSSSSWAAWRGRVVKLGRSRVVAEKDGGLLVFVLEWPLSGLASSTANREESSASSDSSVKVGVVRYVAERESVPRVRARVVSPMRNDTKTGVDEEMESSYSRRKSTKEKMQRRTRTVGPHKSSGTAQVKWHWRGATREWKTRRQEDKKRRPAKQAQAGDRRLP